MIGEAEAEAARDSLLLYNLCCDVGFSREQWQQRVQQSDIRNTLYNYGLQSEGSQSLSMHCGSSTEGVAADFLESDRNVLIALPAGSTVIERSPVPDRATEYNVGYVRLQLVAIGNTEDATVRRVLEHCPRDEGGLTVFNGGQLLQGFLAEREAAQRGPALTNRLSEKEDCDPFLSLHSREWPIVQTEWIHRHRPYNWPSPDTVKEIVDGGCELVAVGHPSSPAPHLEWRLSSSSAEKRLVRSFNIYQIQCYFLLKLVLVFLIKPFVPHTLSSYHMKTIMLHVVETTDPALWTQKNLTHCFMRCIGVLLRFLEHGNCPHYFIPQHNLFDPNVRGETRRQLVRIVNELKAEGWKCVLRCTPFSNIVAPCQHLEHRCPCFITYWHDLKYYELLDSSLVCICFVMDHILYRFHNHRLMSLLNAVDDLLSLNRTILDDNAVYFPCQETVTKLRVFTKGTIGYSLLFAALCRNSQNPRLLGPILQCARQLLRDSCEFDVTSCRLKLATFYYQTGQKDQCIKIVRETLGLYTGGTLPVCVDMIRMHQTVDVEHCRRHARILLLGRDVNTVFRHVAFPVFFTALEIISAPVAVREVQNSRPRMTVTDREFDSILSIDPLIYVCYLLVICYHDLGDPVKSRQTLELMGRTVLNHRQHYLFYPEVARLLLDFCVQYTADRP